MNLILTGYFDASGSYNSEMVIMSGIMVRAGNVRHFARDWRAALRKAPGLAYFKAAEWNALRNGKARGYKEFSPAKGWTKARARERVRELQKIVRKHMFAHLSIAVPMRLYNYRVRHRVSERYDDPHVLAFAMMLKLVGEFCERYQPSRKPVLVFDNDEKNEPVFMEAYSELKGNRQAGRWLGPISFADDKKKMIVQAVDLIASTMRLQARIPHRSKKQLETFVRIKGGIFGGYALNESAMWGWRRLAKAKTHRIRFHEVAQILGD